eukprot:2716348-Rhodomonas_salina.1
MLCWYPVTPSTTGYPGTQPRMCSVKYQGTPGTSLREVDPGTLGTRRWGSSVSARVGIPTRELGQGTAQMVLQAYFWRIGMEPEMCFWPGAAGPAGSALASRPASDDDES